MRGAADTTLQKDMKETQPLVFQPLTSPFDFLTVENEIILDIQNNKQTKDYFFGQNTEFVQKKLQKNCEV